MRLKQKYIAYFLLFLFSIMIGEKIIPHSHVEKENIILPDFSAEKHSEESDHEEGEILHSNFYQYSAFDYSFAHLASIIIDCIIEGKEDLFCSEIPSAYNIQPKALATQLFILHLYTSKSPPSFLV